MVFYPHTYALFIAIAKRDGYTSADVARLLGRSPSYIYGQRRKNRPIVPEDVRCLCKMLDLDFEMFSHQHSKCDRLYKALVQYDACEGQVLFEEITALFNLLGLTYKEIAYRTNIPYGSIMNYSAGANKPSLHSLAEFLEAAGYNPEDERQANITPAIKQLWPLLAR